MYQVPLTGLKSVNDMALPATASAPATARCSDAKDGALPGATALMNLWAVSGTAGAATVVIAVTPLFKGLGSTPAKDEFAAKKIRAPVGVFAPTFANRKNTDVVRLVKEGRLH